jgi:hypothetical protein
MSNTATANMKIVSDFALLDVKQGRGALNKRLANRPRSGPCPDHMRIPVVIHGYIDDVWGSFDGVSQEYTVVVTKVEATP